MNNCDLYSCVKYNSWINNDAYKHLATKSQFSSAYRIQREIFDRLYVAHEIYLRRASYIELTQLRLRLVYLALLPVKQRLKRIIRTIFRGNPNRGRRAHMPTGESIIIIMYIT